ncbi:hypothetical protein [Natronorubrum sp. DTA28]|uniref:hypothetical protein n=1 Tax=Natronorubrum sp. DTA28 TaxID=3447019 RepID=UPI003F86B66B
MSAEDEDEIDQVAQLRRLGIGLVVGGLLFGALSVVGPVAAVGGALLGLGIVVWYEEYTTQRTVGIGPGIGLVGLFGALNAPLSLGFGSLEIAAFAVVGGVADYLLAPAYERVRASGERAGGR